MTERAVDTDAARPAAMPSAAVQVRSISQLAGPQQEGPAPRRPPVTATSGDPGSATIDVAFSCDVGFLQHVAVAIVSLVESNPAATFSIHLFMSGAEGRNEARLAATLAPYRNLTLWLYRVSICGAGLSASHHISCDTYTRIFVADLLPARVSKLLYLDSDIVVRGAIADLWRFDLGDHALAAVPDPLGSRRVRTLALPAGHTYFNAGVLLINVDLWRRRRLSQQVHALIKLRKRDFSFHDQDALNAAFAGRTRTLPFKWNYQVSWYRRWPWRLIVEAGFLLQIFRRPVILHFSGHEKPWLDYQSLPCRELYLAYLSKTRWAAVRSSSGAAEAASTLGYGPPGLERAT